MKQRIFRLAAGWLFKTDTHGHEIQERIRHPLARFLFGLAFKPICELHEWAATR